MLGRGSIFSGGLATYSGPNLLGGKEQFVEEMTQILERLGMLQPPRAADLRISALGSEVTSEGSKRGGSTG